MQEAYPVLRRDDPGSDKHSPSWTARALHFSSSRALLVPYFTRLVRVPRYLGTCISQQETNFSFEAMTSTMHGSKFRSVERPIFLAINHGANRDVYGGLDYTMLLSAHTHRIDVTNVLAHSISRSRIRAVDEYE